MAHSKIHRRIQKEITEHLSCSPVFRELLVLDPPDIESLIRLCSDRGRDVEVRQGCAVVLGALRARRAVGVLVQNMWEGQPSLVASSANAVMQIRSKSATVPLLRVLSECPLPESREAAAMVFKYVRDERAILALQRTLANKNEGREVRFQAADALAAWEPERSLDAFLQASFDQEPEVRWIASYGLAACAGDRAVAALKRLVNDNEAPPGMESVGTHASELLEALARRESDSKQGISTEGNNLE